MKSAPLVAVTAYILFTFALILFGPIIYLGFNAFLTGAFLGAVLLCMNFGYRIGVAFHMRGEQHRDSEPLGSASIGWIFYGCLTISIAALLFSVGASLAAGSINFSTASLGETYIDYYSGYQRNTGTYSIDFLIMTFTTPTTFVATIWGLMYFEKLAIPAKLALVLLIVGTILFYTIGSGKQKQLGDAIIYVIVVMSMRYARSGKAVNIKILLTGIGAFILAMIGFITILGQRYGAISVDLFNINRKSHALQIFDTDNVLFRILGPDLGFSLAMFASYLSQGYFGLSLALQESFIWTKFLGFSYAVSTFANQFLGLDWNYLDTYTYRVGQQTGWGESKWHSTFPYWASDFTFPGVVVLFGFFAYHLARSWLSATRQEDPFAVLMFAVLGLGAVFIPANNQWFISPGGVITVVLIVVLYATSRRRNFPAIKRVRKPLMQNG